MEGTPHGTIHPAQAAPGPVGSRGRLDRLRGAPAHAAIRTSPEQWGKDTIGDVRSGYGITSSSGGLDFVTTGFDVSSS